MKTKYIIMAIIASVATAVFAQGVQGETKTVVATGVGATQKAAETSAIRSAVMTAVGEFIDAETLVENGKLVDDKILSYSSGYVESYKQIGSARALDGGLMEVKILAVVRMTLLQEKVKATIKSAVDVDGKSLFAEILTKQDQFCNAKDMIDSVFKDFPLKVLDAQVMMKANGKPDFAVNGKTGELTVQVRVGVNKKKYVRMLREIQNKIEPLATRKFSIGPIQNRSGNSPRMSLYDSFLYEFKGFRDKYLLNLPRGEIGGGTIFVVENLVRRTGRFYEFDENTIVEIRKWFYDDEKRGGNPYTVSILVSLIDKNGDELSQGKFSIGPEYKPTRSIVLGDAHTHGDGRRNFVLAPLVEMYADVFPSSYNIQTPYQRLRHHNFMKESIGKHGYTKLDGTDEIITISLGKVKSDDLKKAARLECRLEIEYASDATDK